MFGTIWCGIRLVVFACYFDLILKYTIFKYFRGVDALWSQIGMKEEREAEVAEERIRLFNYNTTHFSSDTSLAEEARRLAEIERLPYPITLFTIIFVCFFFSG